MSEKSVEVDAYEGLRTRKAWKIADAERVLEDWSRSGMSMSTFARRHRLGLHRVQWWRDRLSKDSKQVGTAPRLLPAVVKHAPLISLESAQSALRVVVGDVRLELPGQHAADPQWVAGLVRALRRGSE